MPDYHDIFWKLLFQRIDCAIEFFKFLLKERGIIENLRWGMSPLTAEPMQTSGVFHGLVRVEFQREGSKPPYRAYGEMHDVHRNRDRRVGDRRWPCNDEVPIEDAHPAQVLGLPNEFASHFLGNITRNAIQHIVDRVRTSWDASPVVARRIRSR